MSLNAGCYFSCTPVGGASGLNPDHEDSGMFLNIFSNGIVKMFIFYEKIMIMCSVKINVK